MKKKMIIYMSKLSIGGMEKSLINMLKQSNFTKNYDVTLYVLYSMEDKYLKELESIVKVDLLWNKKWSILGKLVCSVKMLFSLIKLKLRRDKYDVSICYPYQHQILSILARNSSDNNIIFIHGNLKETYKDRIEKQKKKLKYDRFSKVVCVSYSALDNFRELHPDYKGKSVAIYNYINGEEILKLSKEDITNDIEFSKDRVTFINISRHDDNSKRISRIIEASNKLKKEKKKFQVLLIGDGEDHLLYKEVINRYNLEKEVLLLGKKINPYPYLKKADCLIMSSHHEGYGVVLDEARILNIPVVTTDVADAKIVTDDGYGILCDNSLDGVYNGMKEFIEKGYKIRKKFDYKEFNSKTTKSLDKIVE